MSANQFIAVICGLKSEAAVVRACAPAEKIRIAVSGASAERAEELARGLCCESAAAILSVGVSGGLAPDLVSGDIILGSAIRTRSGSEYAASANLIASLEAAGTEVPTPRAIIFGSDEIVASAREKAMLFERYGASAVDMESHGAARAARAAGVPFAAIRAIADPASRALPPAALNAVAPDGSTRTLSVLWKCAKAPAQLPALLQLGSDSETALKSLRNSLGGLFRRLLFSLDL
ncbi:MAG: hypothetical protein GC153_03080 [Alphaproteobacteria bacterium]|nr:hypothetical protein [Alphaproteobacteria bacterium]